MFHVDITMHLNKLDFHLHSLGKTVIGLFETWKGFVAKLDVYTQTFKLQLFAILNTERLFQLITKLMELKLIRT